MLSKTVKAASETGKRFGADATSVKNKASGSLPNRSPLQDNANKMRVSLTSDVVASQRADTDRIKKGLSAASDYPKNKLVASTRQEAGGRAVVRTAQRGAAAGAAGAAGYAAGSGAKARQDEVDKKNADTIAMTRKEAPKVSVVTKKDESPSKKKEDAKKPESKSAAKRSVVPERGVREGKNENIDDDVRKRALDSIVNLNKGGMVKKRKCN
jgi:hypothetical protein